MKKHAKEWKALLKPLGLNKKGAISSNNKLTNSYIYNFGVRVSDNNKVVASDLQAVKEKPVGSK
jgi:hypothetical protein